MKLVIRFGRFFTGSAKKVFFTINSEGVFIGLFYVGVSFYY